MSTHFQKVIDTHSRKFAIKIMPHLKRFGTLYLVNTQKADNILQCSVATHLRRIEIFMTTCLQIYCPVHLWFLDAVFTKTCWLTFSIGPLCICSVCSCFLVYAKTVELPTSLFFVLIGASERDWYGAHGQLAPWLSRVLWRATDTQYRLSTQMIAPNQTHYSDVIASTSFTVSSPGLQHFVVYV